MNGYAGNDNLFKDSADYFTLPGISFASGITQINLSEGFSAGTYLENTNPPDAGGSGDFNAQIISVTAVPEPAVWAMLLLGFGGIGWMLRGRREVAA